MTEEITSILVVANNSDSIPVLGTILYNGTARIILWQRNGLYRLIPKSVINNLLDVYENYRRKERTSVQNFPVRWEQGIDVDPKIARILFGE